MQERICYNEYKVMKLQNNYTTPEQSKRLLKLGVPANTGDCYFTESGKKEIKNTALDILYTPCWSVGRLIEIYEICTGETFERNDVYNIFSDIFTSIESALLNHEMDFSKLKE